MIVMTIQGEAAGQTVVAVVIFPSLSQNFPTATNSYQVIILRLLVKVPIISVIHRLEALVLVCHHARTSDTREALTDIITTPHLAL